MTKYIFPYFPIFYIILHGSFLFSLVWNLPYSRGHNSGKCRTFRWDLQSIPYSSFTGKYWTHNQQIHPAHFFPKWGLIFTFSFDHKLYWSTKTWSSAGTTLTVKYSMRLYSQPDCTIMNLRRVRIILHMQNCHTLAKKQTHSALSTQYLST